jgi:hypothetical protein
VTRWFAICACTIGVAEAASAGPASNSLLTTQQPHRISPRSPELRIVRPPVAFDPSPIIQSGMIADTGVAPNARIGVGLFNVSKKGSPTEIRADPRAPKSRKVGVSFRLRF